MYSSVKLCDAKYCFFSIPRLLSQEEKEKLQISTCALCLNANYCSQKCRDLDWTNGHRSVCVPINSGTSVGQNRSKSVTDTDDSAASLKPMNRNPEDFEILVVNGAKSLGKGQYGEVKLVRDKRDSKEYAMKILTKKYMFQCSAIDNIKREIRLQRRLLHPNIIKLYFYFEDKINVYLILEYAENGSLFRYLRKRKRLPEQEAFIYFFQTCLGIDYLHKNKIIHRDLKPENLLLDQNGNVKVCDFGWSAELKTQQQQQQRQAFCGTCEYMAPEMIRNLPHDQTLDIWTLGILLYELLYGQTPFKAKNDHEVCKAIIGNTQIRFNNEISMEAQNLITNLLQQQPSQRLTMKQIFDHPWVQSQAKLYDLDVWQYIYKPTTQRINNLSQQQTQVLTQKNSEVKPPQTIQQKYPHYNEGDGTIKKYESYGKVLDSHRPANNNEDPYLNERVSRFSRRNEMFDFCKKEEEKRNQQIAKEQEIGFMDRVFMAFGCLGREKPKN